MGNSSCLEGGIRPLEIGCNWPPNTAHQLQRCDKRALATARCDNGNPGCVTARWFRGGRIHFLGLRSNTNLETLGEWRLLGFIAYCGSRRMELCAQLSRQDGAPESLHAQISRGLWHNR